MIPKNVLDAELVWKSATLKQYAGHRLDIFGGDMEFKRNFGSKTLNILGIILLYVFCMLMTYVMLYLIRTDYIFLSKHFSMLFIVIGTGFFCFYLYIVYGNYKSKVVIDNDTITVFGTKKFKQIEIGSMGINDIGYICERKNNWVSDVDITASKMYKYANRYYLVDKEGIKRFEIEPGLVWPEDGKEIVIIDYLNSKLGIEMREEITVWYKFFTVFICAIIIIMFIVMAIPR